MSIERGRDTERQGVGPTYPHYLVRISLYARRMHEMGLLSHPERGIFAMTDRDRRPLPPERGSWGRSWSSCGRSSWGPRPASCRNVPTQRSPPSAAAATATPSAGASPPGRMMTTPSR